MLQQLSCFYLLGAAHFLPHKRCLEKSSAPEGGAISHVFAPAGSKSRRNHTSTSRATLPPPDLTIDYNYEAMRQAAKRPKLSERRKQAGIIGSENPPLPAGVAAMPAHLGTMRSFNAMTDSAMELQMVDGGKGWGPVKRPRRVPRQGEKVRIEVDGHFVYCLKQ